MGDAGFFKGTSAAQDSRFSDKEQRLRKTLKFPPEFDLKVDMKRVNLQVMRPWIAKKVGELVGFDDEVVIEYAMGLLEDSSQPPDPKAMQINLTGFLESKTPEFMLALWKLLLSAQDSIGGVPKEFVEEKKQELRLKQAQDEKVMGEVLRRQEAERASAQRLDDVRQRERNDRREGGGRDFGGGRGRGRERDSGWGPRGRGAYAGGGGGRRDHGPPRDRDRSPPPRRRSPSYSPRRYRDRSPPRRRRSRSMDRPRRPYSRSRSPPRNNRYRSRTRSPPVRSRSRTRSPPPRAKRRRDDTRSRSRSRSPPPRRYRGGSPRRSRTPPPSKRHRSPSTEPGSDHRMKVDKPDPESDREDRRQPKLSIKGAAKKLKDSPSPQRRRRSSSRSRSPPPRRQDRRRQSPSRSRSPTHSRSRTPQYNTRRPIKRSRSRSMSRSMSRSRSPARASRRSPRSLSRSRSRSLSPRRSMEVDSPRRSRTPEAPTSGDKSKGKAKALEGRLGRSKWANDDQASTSSKSLADRIDSTGDLDKAERDAKEKLLRQKVVRSRRKSSVNEA